MVGKHLDQMKITVHVLVKGKKGESPAPEPAIKGKRCCLLDGEKKVSMKKQKEIPGRRKSQRGISNIQSEPDPVENTMEEKKIFLVGGIATRRPTTAKHNPGPVQDTIKEMVIIPVG